MNGNRLELFYPARKCEYLSYYDEELLRAVADLGGFYNAHAHLDRAYTLQSEYLAHANTTPLEASTLPLSVKQNLVGKLHLGAAYMEEDLRRRMRRALEFQYALGTRRVDSCIDASPDIAEDGLLAIRVALELKKEFSGRLDVRIGPNAIFGFKEGTRRWSIYEEAARRSDFLCALPEKDHFSFLDARDGKIGFRRHIAKVITLGAELGKRVDLHIDQANDPDERGTEILLEGLGNNPVDSWIDAPKMPDGSPGLRVIHMISPSAYFEDRFARLLEGLLAHNIGVVVCPTAAISMLQIRALSAPLHSSIARVLELAKKKVPVFLGSDNVCDVFVPQGDGDMLTEIKMAGHAVRLAPPHIWAKIAAGMPLDDVDRARIGDTLYQARKKFRDDYDSSWRAAVE